MKCGCTPEGLRTGTVLNSICILITLEHHEKALPWEGAGGQGLLVPCHGHHAHYRMQIEMLRLRDTLAHGEKLAYVSFVFNSAYDGLPKFSVSAAALPLGLSWASGWGFWFVFSPYCRIACIASSIGFSMWVMSCWIPQISPLCIRGFEKAFQEACVWWCDFGICLALAYPEVCAADGWTTSLPCPTLVKALVWHWCSGSHHNTCLRGHWCAD